MDSLIIQSSNSTLYPSFSKMHAQNNDASSREGVKLITNNLLTICYHEPANIQGNVQNEPLGQDHGFAQASPTKEADLAATDERG